MIKYFSVSAVPAVLSTSELKGITWEEPDQMSRMKRGI